MPIDFTKIQTTRGRGYDANMISRLNDSLQAIPIKQRAAILGSVIEESGGNPLARSTSNAYQGLLQWGKDRYRITSNDKEREFAKQIQLIRNTLNDSTDHISWSHGGEGSGYKSFKEPLHIFHNPELPFEDIYRAFSYGYVRPKGKEESYSNRLKVAQQVYNRLNAQPNPTETKQDIVDAVMAIPTAIAEGMNKAVTFGKSMFPQTSQKGSPNRKDNTMRWAEGGYLYQPKDAWDSLSMLEKSEMMRVAVRNGITDLKTIRKKYNEFAEGGDNKWTMEDEAKYMEWRQSLPENLRNTNDNDYDMRGAFKAGMRPTLEADGLYHLGSRDPRTGRILKASHHPTFLQAIATDASMGYYPVTDNNGVTYTNTWKGNQYKDGGGIYIKSSKKGTFTAAAKKHGKSVQAFASQVLAHPENYSPAMRKKANFAKNAAKWHGLGGNLFLTGGPEEKGRGEVTNLSIWDELAAQSPLFYTIGKAIDPTGMSGYGDAREAINQYDSSPSLSKGYTAVMETLGALPIVSKAGKAIKLLQGAITGQGVFDDYNYAQEKKKEYGDELVVDYWDNTVKPRREAERHGEQMKSKMAYTDVHHVPSFKLAPKGSKSGQIISDYDINHRVVKKYKKAFGGNLL